MKFDFADYIRLADRIHECDIKHLNAWAKVPLHGVEFIGVQILDRKDFGDEPLTAIVNRLVKHSIMCKLKVKDVDEANNAVEYVYKWIAGEISADGQDARRPRVANADGQDARRPRVASADGQDARRPSWEVR